jgi:large subunit ribosomal protein L32
MPTPKRKLSRKRRDQRSANKHIIPKSFNFCKQDGCGVALMPHTICAKCGFYNGKKVISVKVAKNTENTAIK